MANNGKLKVAWEYFKGCANVNLKLRFDLLSISHFLGRWIPFAFTVGVITGSIAAFMDLLIVEINKLLSFHMILFFIYPVLVALFAGYALLIDPVVGGPGIGYAIVHLKTKYFLPARLIFLKFLTSTLVLSGGFIAGREGPSFFIGVAIGEWLGKAYGFSKRFKNILGLIGGGAFTGALLKAPLGSSIFAMELENMYDFDYSPFVPMIIASITSYLTFTYFRGESAFIFLTKKPVWTLDSIPYLVVMGLVISFVIYVYTFLFHTGCCVSQFFEPLKRPVIGTIISLPILFLLFFAVHDTEILSAPADMKIVSHLAQVPIPVWIDALVVLGVMIVTSLTLGFGIPGGLVLPNLIIGAAIGNMFGHIFPEQIVMFSLAGMGAALAAGAKTPLAAIVMITEMSNADVVIPMTAAVITSYTTSFGFSLYLGQEIDIKPLIRGAACRGKDT